MGAMVGTGQMSSERVMARHVVRKRREFEAGPQTKTAAPVAGSGRDLVEAVALGAAVVLDPRRAQALHRTLRYRPDLIEVRGGLSETDRRLLEEVPSLTYP